MIGILKRQGFLMKMAKDREQLPDNERVGEELEDDLGEVQIHDPNKPACPRCGWHNTRLSHTTTPVDMVLKVFSFRAFRCRTCGNRFRNFRRVQKS